MTNEEKRAYHATWRAANSEKVKASHAAYYAANSEKVNAKSMGIRQAASKSNSVSSKVFGVVTPRF